MAQKKRKIEPNAENTQRRYIQLANVCFEEIVNSASYGNEFRTLLASVSSLRESAYMKLIDRLNEKIEMHEKGKKKEIESYREQ